MLSGRAHTQERACTQQASKQKHTQARKPIHINTPQVDDMFQDGAFFWENSQVKVWKGKVSQRTSLTRDSTRA